MSTKPSKEIATWKNEYPDRIYRIVHDCPEFTCLCPMTGQPDFGELRIEYVPAEKCLELKSLKLYLWSYRDEGIFHETATNRILEDLVRAAEPRWMRVVGEFNVRGGIGTTVVAEHGEMPAGV
ncbi:MAG: preQ(1) synthase [Candidatus Eisenbacteria bacterium]